jgi:hypothetical protein
MTELAFTHKCLRCGAEYPGKVDFCWTCAEAGWIQPLSRRPAEALLPRQAGMTAKELARSLQTLWIPKDYPYLYVAPASLAILHGPPGSGKTTMALRLAFCLKPAVVFPLETGLGPVLAGLLQRLEIRTQQIWLETPTSLNRMLSVLEERTPRAVVIDSIQMLTLTAQDLLSLARSRGWVIFAVRQERKDGGLRGSNEFAHLADLVIALKDTRWTLEKSRYQPLTGGSVL